ncbi:flagellin [Vibrio ostreicida]|uniref:Flagellin n=1 Tax=Vibrio ostreicida TaxID=526588 RepID=A0ABT8BRX1_9VIBR|nr:flagellin [Vibrio ostreicida]MDN3609448.1 flagellin [Vibrio ostreicida]NPD08331.1 flagellin [Vibrio ostreicida]
MVMSTVEVRPHNVRLTGHDKSSITPQRSSDPDTGLGQYRSVAKTSTPATYSLSGVLLTQGQQNATSVQIGTKSLQVIGGELVKIKQGLTRAMNAGKNQHPSLKEGLSSAKINIERTLESAQFEGKKVLDNQLRLKLDQADIRRFSISGLNVERLKDKAEQIRLDFPQGQSVMIQFDGQSDGKKTVKMLDRNLIPLGLRASLSEDGTIVFESSEKAYLQMQKKVMVTGEGHRFPAGQSNAMTLKPEPEGISELSFDLGSRDGIKKTIATVNQHLRQVQSGLEQAKGIGSQLNAQMRIIHSQTSLISASQVGDKLKALDESEHQFSSVFQALNAQANVRRHSVVALLR